MLNEIQQSTLSAITDGNPALVYTALRLIRAALLNQDGSQMIEEISAQTADEIMPEVINTLTELAAGNAADFRMEVGDATLYIYFEKTNDGLTATWDLMTFGNEGQDVKTRWQELSYSNDTVPFTAPEKVLMPEVIDRTIYVKSQLMRIHILVMKGVKYTLTGTPADNAEPGDEIVESQLELVRIYEEYGLYKVTLVDEIMGWIEKKVGYAINSRRTRTSWTREG